MSTAAMLLRHSTGTGTGMSFFPGPFVPPPEPEPPAPPVGGGGGTSGTIVPATPGALAAAISAASNGATLTLRGGPHVLGQYLTGSNATNYGGIVTSKGLTYQNYTGEVPIVTWPSTVRNNGLYFTGSPSTIIGITFVASSVTTHDANGSAFVELDGGSGLTMLDCTLIGHANMDDHQQFVYQRYGTNILVQNCTFTANGSEGFGFHQYPADGDPDCVVDACLFSGFATSGGVTSDSVITVTDSIFNNNHIGVQVRNDGTGSVITGNSGTGNDIPLDDQVSVTDSGNTWS